jgi:hypothetical protein
MFLGVRGNKLGKEEDDVTVVLVVSLTKKAAIVMAFCEPNIFELSIRIVKSPALTIGDPGIPFREVFQHRIHKMNASVP